MTEDRGRKTADRPLLRERVADLYRQGLRPVAIAERLGKPIRQIHGHLGHARRHGLLPPARSPADRAITAAWRSPKPTQTAAYLAGPREAGAHQGALLAGEDSPDAAPALASSSALGVDPRVIRGPRPGAAAEPPSARACIGKGAGRDLESAPASLPGGAASIHNRGAADEKSGASPGSGLNPRLDGAAPAGAFMGAAEIASIIELDIWVHQSQPGDKCRYHRGELACSRSLLGAALLRLAERGLVELVQRRHGPGDTSYLAIRRKADGKPRTAADVSRSCGRVAYASGRRA